MFFIRNDYSWLYHLLMCKHEFCCFSKKHEPFAFVIPLDFFRRTSIKNWCLNNLRIFLLKSSWWMMFYCYFELFEHGHTCASFRFHIFSLLDVLCFHFLLLDDLLFLFLNCTVLDQWDWNNFLVFQGLSILGHAPLSQILCVIMETVLSIIWSVMVKLTVRMSPMS